MSVIYCVGNVGIKRKSFRKPQPKCVSVDNEDVLAAFSLSGKTYFLLGSLPFENMTVADYMSYNRVFLHNRPIKREEIKFLLRRAGLNLRLDRYVGSLSRVEFRHLQTAAKLDIDTERIMVNFDGLDYSRANAKRLLKMLLALSERYNVFVSVSDGRFIPPSAAVREYSEDGIRTVPCYKRKTAVRPRRMMLKVLKSRGISSACGHLKKVVAAV